MKEFWIIFKFHLTEMMKKKGFLFSCLFIVGVVFASSFFSYRSQQSESKSKDKIIISSSIDSPVISKEVLNKTFKNSDYEFVFEKKSKDEIEKQVKDKDVTSGFSISGTLEKPEITHYYRFQPTQDVSLFIEKGLESEEVAGTLEKAKIKPSLLQDIDAKFTVKNIEMSQAEKSYGLVFPLVFLLYVFIIGFGQSIAMNVVSEKSTKVIEILLPKMNPINSLYAKIASAFTTGLAQLAVTLLSFVTVSKLGWVEGGSLKFLGFSINYNDMTIMTAVWFLFFFLGGFAFYGLLYAGLGSKVSRIEDLGPVLTPIVFLVMGAFGLGIYSIFSPESTISVVASYIPFFSPIVLFSRILLGAATTIEITVSISIFIVSFLFLSHVSKKWFIQGISHYGSPKKRKTKSAE